MAVSLHDALKASYGDRQSSDKLKSAGYVYDSMLSNGNQKVFANPKTKKILFNVAGSHNLADWVTDGYLLAGKLKDTNRYKEADAKLKMAKTKYAGYDVSVTGHSLGSTIGQQIASKGSDKFFGLDGGFTVGKKVSDNKNFHNYRTSGDLVSLLGSGSKNMTTLRNNNWLKDPISSHNVDNIKNEQIFV